MSGRTPSRRTPSHGRPRRSVRRVAGPTRRTSIPQRGTRGLLIGLISVLLLAIAMTAPGGGGIATVTPSPSERPSTWDTTSEGLTYVRDETVLADCLPADYGCLGQAFANLTYNEGVSRAHTELELRMESDLELRINCHRITHLIGAAAIARFDGNAARAFAEGFRGCGEGYQHGVIARAFEGSIADTVPEIAEWGADFCADPVIAGEQGLYLNCLHGIGHGFTTALNYELFDALDACRGAFPEPGFAVDQCLNGVFMETFGPVSGIPSPYLDEENPFAPCDEIDAATARNCWGYAASRLIGLRDGFDPAITECLTLDNPTAREACVEGVSWEAGVQERANPDALFLLCTAAGDLSGECLGSAVHAIAAYEYGVEGIAQAVCAAAADDARADCFRRLGAAAVIEGLTKGEPIELICERIGQGETARVDACRAGAAEAATGL